MAGDFLCGVLYSHRIYLFEGESTQTKSKLLMLILFIKGLANRSHESPLRGSSKVLNRVLLRPTVTICSNLLGFFFFFWFWLYSPKVPRQKDRKQLAFGGFEMDILAFLADASTVFRDWEAEDDTDCLSLRKFCKAHLFSGSSPVALAMKANQELKEQVVAFVRDRSDFWVPGATEAAEMLKAEFDGSVSAGSIFVSVSDPDPDPDPELTSVIARLSPQMQQEIAEGKRPPPVLLNPGDKITGLQDGDQFHSVITRTNGEVVVQSDESQKVIKKKIRKPEGWDSYDHATEWRTGQYARIPFSVFQDARLEPTSRLVLIALATFANSSNGACFPSREQIAERTGMAISTISRATEKLERLGWISKCQESLKSSVQYHLHIPKQF